MEVHLVILFSIGCTVAALWPIGLVNFRSSIKLRPNLETELLAQSVDGPDVNLVEVPLVGIVIDVAVNWLDEALIVVWRNGGESGIAQCSFGNGA